MLPRSDVSAGFLQGLGALLLMAGAKVSGIVDFEIVQGFIVLGVMALGGYMPARFKPFYMTVSGALAALAVAVVARFVFGAEFDQGALTNFLTVVAGALGVYKTPPYSASPMDPHTPALPVDNSTIRTANDPRVP